MEATRDYYATLRVPPEAESAAIRVAYRNLMRRYHPDVNPSDEAASEAVAINEAYACLRDPSERAVYDRRRTARSTARGSAAASRKQHASMEAWRAEHAYVPEPKPRFQPGWRDAVALGLATLLTIVTFTTTAATIPAEPAATEALVIERLD